MGEAVLEGELSGHSFVEILQLSVNKKEKLKIELFDVASPFGEVYLDGATLLEARVDALSGIPALGAMLSLSEGHFRVSRDMLAGPGSLNVAFDVALFECAELHDHVPRSTSKTHSSLPPTRIPERDHPKSGKK